MMTNLEIYSLYLAISQIMNDKELKIPIKVGYILLKNRNLLNPYFQAINEQRTNIILQYVDSKDTMVVPQDKIEEANNKLQEILEMEENIELQKININDFEGMMQMDIINGLMPIITEEEN